MPANISFLSAAAFFISISYSMPRPTVNRHFFSIYRHNFGKHAVMTFSGITYRRLGAIKKNRPDALTSNLFFYYSNDFFYNNIDFRTQILYNTYITVRSIFFGF